MTLFTTLVQDTQPLARRLTAHTSDSAEPVLDQGILRQASAQRLRPSQVSARGRIGDAAQKLAPSRVPIASLPALRSHALQFTRDAARGDQHTHVVRGSAEATLEPPTAVTAQTQNLIDAQVGGGTPLEGSLRKDMESLLGVRLEHVRLHGGPETDTLVQRLGANAFTQGQHVFLQSERSLHTDAGRETLAHELTHVARGAPSVGAVMRQPQTNPTKQPQQADAVRVASLSLPDLIDKENPSADDLRKTREYVAYMDPKLIWQWKFRARPEEALEACRMILYHLKRGEQVDWSARALDFLLNARELLKPEVVDRTPPKFAAKHHYRIELKAWIPHAQVDDPVPAVTDSHYRGDNHRGYDGTWRVLNWVEFDWDGKKISGFHGDDNYGTSHRDWKRWGLSGTESKTATGFTGRELNTEGYFTMWISSKNPIPLVSPEINSTLDVFATCDSISLVYTTDEFPSHGIRVFQDSKVVETKIVFDASAVDGTDAAAIFLGLTDFDNQGDFDVAVPPDLEACQLGAQPPATVSP